MSDVGSSEFFRPGPDLSPDRGSGGGGSDDVDVRKRPYWSNLEGGVTSDSLLGNERIKSDVAGRVNEFRSNPVFGGEVIDDQTQVILRLTDNGRFVDEWLEARKPGSGEDLVRKVTRAYGRLERIAVEKGFVSERENRQGLLEGEVKCGFCGGVISGLLAEGARCIHCAAGGSNTLITQEQANYVDVDLSRAPRYVSDSRARSYPSVLRDIAREANNIASLESPDERVIELKEFRKQLRSVDATVAKDDLDSTLYRAMRDNMRLVKEGRVTATVDAEVGVVLPEDEDKLRLFLRKKIREVVRLTETQDDLTKETVIRKLVSGLGFDPKTFRPIDLYPEGLGDRRDEVRESIEREIEARCLLRIAELQEQGYKQMADKGKAVERYIAEVKGSEANPAKAVFLSRDVYVWLKGLEDLGDRLTAEGVDRAFQLMVLMGENDIRLLSPELFAFEKFIKVVPNGMDPSKEDSKKNLYDPSYPDDLRKEFFVKVDEMCGKDARNLAWQLFQAFKEEGNYNWQHYMSRLFTFGKSRHAVTKLSPPVYTGSRRVYMKEERETFSDEYYDENGKRKRQDYSHQLARLALSPLRVRVKTGNVEVEEEGEKKNKDVKEREVLLDRARRGRLLAETRFESVSWMTDLPQQSAFLTIDKGNELRQKIVDIGKLGEAEDKGAKVGEAVGLLSDVRRLGMAMAMGDDVSGGLGVFTTEELDRQVVLEARNIVWEMSVDNPDNIADINLQEKTKPRFLTPSHFNALFERFGGYTAGMNRIIGSDEEYMGLGSYVQRLRKYTYERWLTSSRMVASDNPDTDAVFLSKEKTAVKKVLPTKLGGKVLTPEAARFGFFDAISEWFDSH